jgi:winged helix-turn helix protein
LSGEEQALLPARARSVRGPYRDRLRAAIMLAIAAGQINAAIAQQLGVCTDTLRKWQRRFAAGGVADAPRSGRPLSFTAAVRAEVVALPGCLICTLGPGDGRPLGPSDYVICADQKTSIQARCRCHPPCPCKPAPCESSTITTAAAPWPT